MWLRTIGRLAGATTCYFRRAHAAARRAPPFNNMLGACARPRAACPRARRQSLLIPGQMGFAGTARWHERSAIPWRCFAVLSPCMIPQAALRSTRRRPPSSRQFSTAEITGLAQDGWPRRSLVATCRAEDGHPRALPAPRARSGLRGYGRAGFEEITLPGLDPETIWQSLAKAACWQVGANLVHDLRARQLQRDCSQARGAREDRAGADISRPL